MAGIEFDDRGRALIANKTLGSHLREAGAKAKTEISQIRLPEFLLFGLLIYGEAVPGLGVPANQLLLFIILAYSLTKKAIFSLGPWKNIILLLGLGLGYLALVSITADPSEYASDWFRRWIRMLASLFLIVVLAEGRLHLRSAILGYATALGINAIAFFAGLAPDTYGGYLTGYLNDKNYAGLVHALYALLVITAIQKRWQQVLVLSISLYLLWETGSRTSMAALLFAYLWILFSARLNVILKLVSLAVFSWGLSFLTENYADNEAFGDRSGTDALRERIDEMSLTKVEATGFFGQGLGEAYVYDELQERTWFFHNSYWSAYVEGGWPWAVLVVAITLLVAVRPFSTRKDWSYQELAAQGLGIALLVCSLRLGEVFMTLPWAVCMGYVLRVYIINKQIRKEQLHIPIFGYDQLIEEKK